MPSRRILATAASALLLSACGGPAASDVSPDVSADGYAALGCSIHASLADMPSADFGSSLHEPEPGVDPDRDEIRLVNDRAQAAALADKSYKPLHDFSEFLATAAQIEGVQDRYPRVLASFLERCADL